MAILSVPDKSRSEKASPFFSRAYGGYTRGQIDFYERLLGNSMGKRLLDPMAGQGYAISSLAFKGGSVCLGDVNPAPLLLASLRDPRVISQKAELVEWLSSCINKLMRKRRRKPKDVVVEDWLSEAIKIDLHDYGNLIGVGLFPKMFSTQFWDGEIQLRFAVAILALAARDFVCFRKSDNVTWLKPGWHFSRL